jgi:hypothetical protein
MEPAGLTPNTASRTPSPSRDGSHVATSKNNRNSVVPPYWQDNGRPTPISLEDHTDDGSEQCKALWAKGVTIDDYVVVSGTAPGLGAYVVWNCTVETLDVSLKSEGAARS